MFFLNYTGAWAETAFLWREIFKKIFLWEVVAYDRACYNQVST